MHSIQQEQLHDLLVLGGALGTALVIIVTLLIINHKSKKNQ